MITKIEFGKLTYQQLKSGYELMLEQLKQSQIELKDDLEAQGGCDHSVGICVCGLIRLIEENEAVIKKCEVR